jgi:hypothetical protein
VQGGERVVGEAGDGIEEAEECAGILRGALEKVFEITFAEADDPRAAACAAERAFDETAETGSSESSADGQAVAEAFARFEGNGGGAAVGEGQRMSAGEESERFGDVTIEEAEAAAGGAAGAVEWGAEEDAVEIEANALEG